MKALADLRDAGPRPGESGLTAPAGPQPRQASASPERVCSCPAPLRRLPASRLPPPSIPAGTPSKTCPSFPGTRRKREEPRNKERPKREEAALTLLMRFSAIVCECRRRRRRARLCAAVTPRSAHAEGGPGGREQARRRRKRGGGRRGWGRGQLRFSFLRKQPRGAPDRSAAAAETCLRAARPCGGETTEGALRPTAAPLRRLPSLPGGERVCVVRGRGKLQRHRPAQPLSVARPSRHGRAGAERGASHGLGPSRRPWGSGAEHTALGCAVGQPHRRSADRGSSNAPAALASREEEAWGGRFLELSRRLCRHSAGTARRLRCCGAQGADPRRRAPLTTSAHPRNWRRPDLHVSPRDAASRYPSAHASCASAACHLRKVSPGRARWRWLRRERRVPLWAALVADRR